MCLLHPVKWSWELWALPACSSLLGCPSCLPQCLGLVSHSCIPWLYPSEESAVDMLTGEEVVTGAEQFAFGFFFLIFFL